MKNRRDFLKFMGLSSAQLSISSLALSCASSPPNNNFVNSIKSTSKDDVVLAEGFESKVLISWQDPIDLTTKKFGFNNDFISIIPTNSKEAIMWVNHESVNSMFVSNYFEKNGQLKTKKQIQLEKENVGGSVFKIIKVENVWQVDLSSPINNRLDGNTKIEFSPSQKIKNKSFAVGTFANCAGGKTPWNTFLTCEENTYNFVGDTIFDVNSKKHKSSISRVSSWEAHEKLPPEHYGWVVEYDPMTKKSKKLVSLGRFAHECATTIKAKNNNTVVYMADDKADEHVYKFISEKPGSLEKGILYVADTKKGLWKKMEFSANPKFAKLFKNQQDLLIHSRVAAKVLGATPLDRPEDIEIHPESGEVYIALTNNKKKGNYHGSILKIIEKNNNPLSLEFKAETFKLGGRSSGFSCPDNLVFDKKGNLWLTTDISGSQIGKGHYKNFGNNGLFFIPMSGPQAGQIIQIASAPVEAEFTGPCFSSDYKTLFLSVQHPGEKTKSLNKLHSNWPTKKHGEKPKPSVIYIEGPGLNRLMS